MYKILLFGVLFFTACNNEAQNAIKYGDTPVIYMEGDPTVESLTDGDGGTNTATANTYSNERFKDVTISKTGAGTYQVKGKAQVFEAAFSWVLMKGNSEVKSGHEMTNAGAPEFGDFSFTVEVPQDAGDYRLMLYEASAKDGSRQHQLTIPLGS